MTIASRNVGQVMPMVGLDTLRRGWGWFLALGIVLIVLGIFAVGWAAVVTVASVIIFGWLLIAGGVMQALHAFWRKRWGGFFVDLLTGILYVVAGFVVVANPGTSAAALTLLIAMFLIIGGLFRIAASATACSPNWGWILVHGIISLLLGIAIWRRWPVSGLWVIGLFIGIEMMLNGWTLVALGLAARKLPQVKRGSPARSAADVEGEEEEHGAGDKTDSRQDA